MNGQQMFLGLFSSPLMCTHVVGPALSYALSRFEAWKDFDPKTFGPPANRATADSIQFILNFSFVAHEACEVTEV